MTEFERINYLVRNVATEEERSAVLEAQNVLDRTFKSILDSVKQRLFGMLEENETMDGSQESPSMVEVISAMGSLQKIGSGYGQEFSIPETEREAAAYVARYGSEIVRS